MSTSAIITCAVLVLCAAFAGFVLWLDHRRRHFNIGEELVIRVVEEQLKKEVDRAKDMGPFDKQQRRRACMQRFERYAREHGIPLPIDLAARIHAQLTIKGA